MAKKTALITGASSGIGKELARYHASKGGHLIITARREAQLHELKDNLVSEFGIDVDVIAVDLGAIGGASQLIDAVRTLGKPIDILINNAGFGGHGKHIERDLAQEKAMIDVNIVALVELCNQIGADMAHQGGGKILNVGSTAGFVPGPNQAVYFATKAFVNSFSQALDQELRNHNVSVTVLAPGYVETEFAQAANLEGTQMVQAGGATAQSVAKHGYDSMMAGKLVTVNEKALRFMLNWIVPLLPRRTVLNIIEKSQSKG